MGRHNENCQESGKKIMWFCASRRLVTHVLDSTILLILVLFQSSILNYYIIRHFKTSVSPYFWFAGDFICLFIFGGTLTTSYRYLTRCKECEPCKGEKSFYLSPKRIVSKFPTSKLGMLPLSYVSWFLYSALLLAKVLVIFKSEIPENLNLDDVFGPQLLQIAIALSGIVFLLLVEGHNWAERGSPRYMYVTGICGKTGIEILDTVSVLGILLLKPTNLSETFPTPTLENVIIVLAAFNFFLPVLALYKLSLSDFAAQPFSLPIAFLYNFLHLFFVDLPFLIIRINLWINYNQHASLFIMKNVFSLTILLRNMIPDLKDLCVRARARSHTVKPQDPKRNGISTELQGLNSGDNFEEIILEEHKDGKVNA